MEQMIAYKYKLRPCKTVEQKMCSTLELCRELYNASLQERRDAYRLNRISINYYDQANQLSEIKELRPYLAAVHSQVLQAVLKRSDRSFQNFFRRVKAGQKPGYPRFKGKNRFDSFCYPQSGFRFDGNKLTLSKIGSMRVRLSREIHGRVKTCTVNREADGWYVVFAVEPDRSIYLPRTGKTTGIDVGIESFATLSDGSPIENPRHLRKSDRKLKTLQKAVSRRKRGGSNRRKAVEQLRKRHLKVARQRQDFLHKLSLDLISRFDAIAAEDLNIAGMMGNHHLAKSIADASWGTFFNILCGKAERAGRTVVKVEARHTSQECSGCGTRVKKRLSERIHECLECGLKLHRDHNAAVNIKGRALSISGPLGMGGVALPGEPGISAL